MAVNTPLGHSNGRKFLVLGGLVGLLVIAFIALHQSRKPQQPVSIVPNDAPGTQAPQLAAEPVTAPAVAKKPATRVEKTSVPVAEQKARSTKELVAEMLQICGARGPITKEQAEQFQKDLEELIGRGAESVPAIRDFIAKNMDADFGQLEGGDQLSYSSLRAAMFDALKRIGGPEAQGAMLQALQTSAVPGELLDLANGLEAQAPGQYRTDILKAAREALEMAAANQLGTNAELGPAYRILNTYGEAGTAESLSTRDPDTFSKTLEMATLPNGEGLPDLLKMAQNKNPEASGQILATEMIAQMAGNNDDALKALLDMAQNEQISNRVWTRLAPILGGEQYQLTQAPGDGTGDASGAPQYTMVDTAQTPAQVKDRIDVINHFLQMVQPDSAAASALLNELNVLQQRLN